MTTYREQMAKAIDASKKDGKRRRKLFNKSEFLKEFPDLAKDPRSALTPDNFVFDVTPLQAITVTELRDMCLGCEHEKAVQLGLNIAGLSDNQIVNVLKEDLDLLTKFSKGSPKKPMATKKDSEK